MKAKYTEPKLASTLAFKPILDKLLEMFQAEKNIKIKIFVFLL